MKNVFKLKYLTFVPVIALALTACNPGASTATSQPAAESKTAATAAPTQETKAQAVEATVAPTEVVPPTEEATAEDSGSFSDVAENLNNLSSYRMRMVYGFTGKDKDQKDVSVNYEIVQETIKASGDYHMRMNMTDDSKTEDKTTTFDMYQVDKVSYMVNIASTEDAKCLSFSSNVSDTNTGIDPKDMLGGGLTGAKLVEKDVQVNGVKADHYTYADQTMTLGGDMKGSGEYWIAQDGRYVVKYSGKATGKSSMLLAEAEEGTITWDYNLEAVNSLEKIELPKECEDAKPANDIPVPENATDKGQFGTMLTFKTTDAPEDVAKFYKAELPKQGWKLAKDDTLGEMVSLEYTKEKRTLSLMITKGDDGTSVLITEKKEE